MTAHSESSSYHRIFLGGLSQGGLLSLSTLIRLESQIGTSLGGVVAFIGYLPTTPTDAAMHWCFPLAPMELPTGTAADVIKNTPLLLLNGYEDTIVPWFASDFTYWMFRPLYIGTPNYAEYQE